MHAAVSCRLCILEHHDFRKDFPSLCPCVPSLWPIRTPGSSPQTYLLDPAPLHTVKRRKVRQAMWQTLLAQPSDKVRTSAFSKHGLSLMGRPTPSTSGSRSAQISNVFCLAISCTDRPCELRMMVDVSSTQISQAKWTQNPHCVNQSGSRSVSRVSAKERRS